MFERQRQHDRPGAANARDAESGVAGKATLTEQLDAGPSEPLFAGEAEWEEIDPDSLEVTSEPPAQDADEDVDDDADAALAADGGDKDGGDKDEADGKDEAGADGADGAVAAKASASGGRRRNRPDGPRGRYAGEHRKQIRDYKIGKKRLAVGDLAGNRFGYANERSPELRSDRKISIDLNTVVGSRRNNYKNAYVLVWKATDKDKPSNDPTGWIKVGKLPRRARRDIARVQNEKRRELRRGSGPGHKARGTGTVLAINPTNPQGITEKLVPRTDGGHGLLEPFRIAGGSVDAETGERSSTPLANYTHNPARYGDNIVGVWNPPGSRSGGKRNAGSGGIRVFVPLGKRVEVCDVSPITIENYDRKVGTGSSTWIYVTTRLHGERIYFWMLRSWKLTMKDGSSRDGSNV